MIRMVFAGLIGGTILFLWGAVSHMILPLGEIGVKTITGEERLLKTMKEHMPHPGIYLFPGQGVKNPSPEIQQALAARYATGPVGIIAYNPAGSTPMSTSHLITEFLTNTLAALMAAFILSRLTGRLPRRVLCVTLFGVLGWLTVSVPQWNWYSFPIDYTLASLVNLAAGWTLAGWVLARIIRPIRHAA